jgi:hypothetical protein
MNCFSPSQSSPQQFNESFAKPPRPRPDSVILSRISLRSSRTSRELWYAASVARSCNAWAVVSERVPSTWSAATCHMALSCGSSKFRVQPDTLRETEYKAVTATRVTPLFNGCGELNGRATDIFSDTYEESGS